ncbi:HesA/MoeB/ThiF family protein [Anaerotignum propionicum]|jgi:molybdopterin/thiamine biosynthesis adenylyltransferase|uniref:Molybdopterin or thiamine biosynthesis adenylyltransferase n=1 Tax=Anaerotignum propionicum DSM 1682 TaxID=991789 RepID=A0A0X1U8T4_ANAPI|nr:HesA/MoeB/ThiF family protein [Anaerotignum propionicum]AMJ41341.1 molybdopterin-synthase adenylyltransferase [Anaerotignum propionicum DSM 1682]MEA5057693.1 HesA/MoeB/ThiF family protein [Anaerotignum propionicum]SHE97443.1 Molybdopterin or thiamine biosynthesis adenylyltransferase [[Clostridium] propionicum DSM 1682] [Anaerotignum propionicum DSM 1682]
MTNRFQRNGIFTGEEQQQLKHKKIAVIGCGGLGGYAIEMFARVGIGHLTVVDGDVFDETNLNRQLLCVMDTLGKPKTAIAAERVRKIDPTIQVNSVWNFIENDNVKEIIKGHDIVIDALDSNVARYLLVEACREMEIPYVYGAIAGWYGQVSVIFPGDMWVRNCLMTASAKGIESEIGNPSFSPACIASYQVSQALKVLLDKGGVLREQILFFDMLNNEFEILEP